MSSDDDAPPTATATSVKSGRPLHVVPRARLRAVYPPELAWQHPVAYGRVEVGRVGTDSAPALGHETVSRSHLAIEWEGKTRTHVATDLGSRNGTRIDGAIAAKTPLQDGSLVEVGDVCLVYEVGDCPEVSEVSLQTIPGEAPAIARLRARVARAAADPSAVLLVGETGTGKEWIAREVHRLSGRSGPLVAVNCSALNPQIVDSQLFGHVRGAFTGAATDHAGFFRDAGGGTIFLDEIGDLPLDLQPKLLRTLEEGEVQPVGGKSVIKVDVRVVAATNADLPAAIEGGTFRRDLYARLALWEIAVPPLRQRRGDVLGWIGHLLERFNSERGRTGRLDLSPSAAAQVLQFDWPDNLRGISRLIHELAAEGVEQVDTAQLPAWILDVGHAAPTAGSPAAKAGVAAPSPIADRTGPAATKPPVPSKDEFIAQFEQLQGNVRALAKHFQRDRRQIYRWIESYGLTDRRGQ